MAAPQITRAPSTGVWPLDPAPAVVRGFDPPAVRWGSGHRGVDLLGSLGDPVHAALGGVVSFAGSIAGRGVVVVDHGGRRTTYEPLIPAVHRGDQVTAGAVLGRLTFVGTHCQPRVCLHWGLVEGDRYLDPLTLAGGPRPVRLYPTTDFPGPGGTVTGSTGDAADAQMGDLGVSQSGEAPVSQTGAPGADPAGDLGADPAGDLGADWTTDPTGPSLRPAGSGSGTPAARATGADGPDGSWTSVVGSAIRTAFSWLG